MPVPRRAILHSHRTLSSLVGLVLVVTGGLLSGDVRAQSPSSTDAPYTPRKFQTSELIDFGTYENTPLTLPWEVKNVEEIAVHSRLDFKHEMAASYRKISEYFKEAYREQTGAVTLKKKASPTASSLELKIHGHSTSDDGERFTLGHDKLMRKFYLDLRRDDGSAFLIFRNASFTRLFGGMVPQQAPFTPIRAETVPLL